MKLNPNEVEKVAGLARLTVTQEEKERFSEQLSSILTHMDALNKVSTEGGADRALGEEYGNVLREDKVQPSFSQEEALLNAPQRHSGFFKVPKILGDR